MNFTPFFAVDNIQIPKAVPSEVCACSRLIVGIAGSNLTNGMDVRLLRLSFVV